MSHESLGISDEWYTPKYIFDALQCTFDCDVCSPTDLKYIQTPANVFIHNNSLELEWSGFVWMNPPFGGRNGIIPWLNKLFLHGNGIALTPDRTSSPWWQEFASKSDAHLQIKGKIKFIDKNGIPGKHPSNGTTLFAFGNKAVSALLNGQKNGLGLTFIQLEYGKYL